MARTFIDTNIFAYAVSSDDPAKEEVARRFLVEQDRDGEGVISTQVLQELFSLLTRKRGYPPPVALEILYGLESFQLFETNRSSIYLAAQISAGHRISFWDALILAAAISTGCGRLLTEDLNHGQIIEGVQVVNPFVSS